MAGHAADDGPGILAMVWILFVFAATILVLRFVSRIVSSAALWWDDWLAVLSIATCLVDAILQTVAVTVDGLGRHVDTLPPGSGPAYLRTFVGSEICYLTIIATAKYSILCYFWRIFGLGRMKWSIYLMGIIVTLWWIGTLITTLVQCTPLKALWDRSKGTCVSTRATFLGNSIPNIVTDFMLMLMPLPFIWGLQMRTWQKIGLSSAFALGSLVTVISIIRLVIAVAHFSDGADPTWNFVPLIKWSTAELYLAPTTASLPSLGPLIRRYWRESVTEAYYLHGSGPRKPASRTQPTPGSTIREERRLEGDGFQRIDEVLDYGGAVRDIAGISPSRVA